MNRTSCRTTLIAVPALTLPLLPAFAAFSDENLTAQEINKAYSEAVVAIYDPSMGPDAVMGTGFIVDRAGHLVTNYHVIEGLESLGVKLASKATVKVRKSMPPARLSTWSSSTPRSQWPIRRRSPTAAAPRRARRRGRKPPRPRGVRHERGSERHPR